MINPYVLLIILNLIILLVNKYFILYSLFISLIWGRLFIENNFIYSILVLSSLLINTFASYILKYNYSDNKDKQAEKKIPSYVFVLSILTSIGIYNLSKNKKLVKNNIDFIKLLCFIIVFYIVASLLEHFIHKHLMHCNVEGKLNKFMKKRNFTKKIYSEICENHINHHKEVKPNMRLTGTELEGAIGLFMGWDVLLYLIIIMSVFIYPINKLFGFNFCPLLIFLGIFLVSLFWCYIWNKVHPEMHESKENISINIGPIENKLKLKKTTNMLLDNHKNHHLQKGEKKGNYNVIFLGADEWFNKNVTDIDNKEYCKTHHEEVICKDL